MVSSLELMPVKGLMISTGASRGESRDVHPDVLPWIHMTVEDTTEETCSFRNKIVAVNCKIQETSGKTED
jgi:hypothetical protein